MAAETRDEAVAGGESSGGVSFEWDENSQLYFHASSGFYHDPNAGWYYSSMDGVYYTVQNGNYVPLDVNFDPDSSSQDPSAAFSSGPHVVGSGAIHDCSDGVEDNRPPSEWLEETLINIYLSGYSKPDPDENLAECSEMELDKNLTAVDGKNHESEELKENLHISEDIKPFTPDDYLEEENWKAQFGQVVKTEDDKYPNLSVIDLWDWSIASEGKKHQEVQLVGRLVRQSKKLHPSLLASGLLKTARICEVHLDLVRVATGKIYRLRSPSSKYLASLPAYDASDPTKDWNFPTFNVSSFRESNCLQYSNDANYDFSSVTHHHHLAFATGEIKIVEYRDRAAERRSLHGGYGIGLGQKRERNSEEMEETKLLSEVEAINMSCGPGSYSRRILESMGWKEINRKGITAEDEHLKDILIIAIFLEGEALGRRKDGILEPLHAIGNRGNMGLGWIRSWDA